MSVWVTSLNSGSNGNCYYIGNDKEAVLIDAGLTCRETEKRMRQLDLDIKKVRAIFISHEHGDHIKGVEVISHKYKIPVYITPKTLSHSRLKKLNPVLTVPFQTGEIVEVGDLHVTPFSKYHDAADAHSFIVTYNEVTIGVFTDLGRVCDQLKHYYNRCHAAFLEANYDEEMLEKGRYPYHLKQRISNGWGHLSNKQAFELFDICNAPHLSHLFLSHLSADNNHPDIALEIFRRKATNVNVTIASRYAPMALQEIGHSYTSNNIKLQPATKMRQTLLFEI
ncbi:MBL fold metallo-hydrolase [Taibaiella lutea]|uniref:MBL fold metallo-hydrolase n=1 Tax=Taibaiella lutea TaxID=2608001 RepID=A0A5M6CTL7_9BACT|nr:MBL fold metallo-hydrolase [Taibaiella lutea]KAA5536355.1 MBL fold metallo-hydrolase [Taibaiella lutea]